MLCLNTLELLLCFLIPQSVKTLIQKQCAALPALSLKGTCTRDVWALTQNVYWSTLRH